MQNDNFLVGFHDIRMIIFWLDFMTSIVCNIYNLQFNLCTLHQTPLDNVCLLRTRTQYVMPFQGVRGVMCMCLDYYTALVNCRMFQQDDVVFLNT